MSKHAKIIIGISVVVLLIISGGAFIFSQKPKVEPIPSPQTEVLGITTAPEPEPKTTLEIIIEPVFVKSPGEAEAVPAVHNQEVVTGTTISTGKGGRAQVLFANNSVTRLDENSEIVIEKDTKDPSNILIKLKKNRIWSRIAKVVGLASFETESPSVLASVRGTSYGHEITANGDKITTTKGTVTGECVENPKAQLTEKGTKTNFNCKNNKIKNEPISQKDKEDEWFKFNQEQDKKLNERFGENAYGDEGDVLGLSDQISPTPTPQLVTKPTVVLIECVGPDGKTSKATQADCDNLNKFWREHPPAPNGPYSTGNSNSSNTSSTTPSSTSTPAANPTPTLTQTPIPVQYPLITNLTHSPTAFDGQSACELHSAFRAQDPAGLISLQIETQVFDRAGAAVGEPTRTSIQGIDGQTEFIIDAAEPIVVPVTIPPNGKLFWRIIADGNTQDATTTTEGTPIQETIGLGCNSLL